MATIAWISAATIAGGVISIAIAALFALSAPASWVPALVSFAIGTLLGAVFLEILPHAIGSAGNLQALFATVLAGILGFFVLEKLVLWRHCHVEDCEAHDHHADPSDGGRSGLMIIIGDGFHNFVDGILIAAAFLQSTELGVVTAAAIIAHEIPQEIGDFVILLHSATASSRRWRSTCCRASPCSPGRCSRISRCAPRRNGSARCSRSPPPA